MAKKKNIITQTVPQTEIETDNEIVISSDPEEKIKSICDNLAEIRKLEGVIGYIFRSETGATIDLNEPDNIIDYAMVSTEILETSQVVEQQFDTGSIKWILAEGKTVKVLCIADGENRATVFMDTAFDHEEVKQKLVK